MPRRNSCFSFMGASPLKVARKLLDLQWLKAFTDKSYCSLHMIVVLIQVIEPDP